jgi:hypothetical protein
MPTSQRTLPVLAIILAGAPAWAQSTTGAIQGTVTDAGSGQPFPAVLVTASSTAQQPQTEITDASGQFYLSNLPPGTYVARATRRSPGASASPLLLITST